MIGRGFSGSRCNGLRSTLAIRMKHPLANGAGWWTRTVVGMGTRTRGPAALLVIGLALAGCGGGSGGDKADSATTTTTQAVDAGAGVATGGAPTAPVDGFTAGTPGAPGAPGSASATGGSVTGSGSVTGGSATAEGGAPGAPGVALGGAQPGSGGGTGSSQPSVAATPEQCAALHQALAAIDHPALRQLQAQTGC